MDCLDIIHYKNYRRHERKKFAKQRAIDKHREKCKKGALRMFVKYFDNFWF